MPAKPKVPAPSKALVDELVIANKILYNEGAVDAFGHVSVRHDKDPTKYLMASHMAPALVTAKDIATFDFDSVPIIDIAKRYYSERFIHGEIYRLRPDVLSVVHCHAPDLIPFGVTKTPLKPISHMGGFLGAGVPVFDIKKKAGMTDMLIRTPELGKALAKDLGKKHIVLMRGHGATMVGASLAQAVYRAIYANFNAGLQQKAMQLGKVTYLEPEEAMKAAEANDRSLLRAWNLWAREVS